MFNPVLRVGAAAQGQPAIMTQEQPSLLLVNKGKCWALYDLVTKEEVKLSEKISEILSDVYENEGNFCHTITDGRKNAHVDENGIKYTTVIRRDNGRTVRDQYGNDVLDLNYVAWDSVLEATMSDAEADLLDKLKFAAPGYWMRRRVNGKNSLGLESFCWKDKVEVDPDKITASMLAAELVSQDEARSARRARRNQYQERTMVPSTPR